MPISSLEFKQKCLSLLESYIKIVAAKKKESAGAPVESYLDGYINGLESVLREIEKIEE